MVFVRNSIIAKRLQSLDGKESEVICIDVTISKKKGVMLCSNVVMFFNELNLYLNQCFNKYDCIIVMGDLNIDVSNKRKYNNNFLSDLCDTFSLQNILTGKTCHESSAGTSIDIMLQDK